MKRLFIFAQIAMVLLMATPVLYAGLLTDANELYRFDGEKNTTEYVMELQPK